MAMVYPLSAATKERLEDAGDWLAVSVAASLPWSTSATGIFIALWLLTQLCTLDITALRRELAKPAGALPVMLWVVGAVGMLWADVPWQERFAGLGSFNKLLLIPLLLTRFHRSRRGIMVLYGFLASATTLLLASWTLKLLPNLSLNGKYPGVPVHDYIIQATEFLMCAFVLLEAAIENIRSSRQAIGFWLFLFASIFLANIFFVATGRTELIVIPVLLVIICWRQLGWKGLIGGGVFAGIIAVGLWFSSPYFNDRILRSVDEYQNMSGSTAYHVEFLRKSLSIVETAPVFGHGTGSIEEQFQNAAINQTGLSATVTVNPHNQIFAVAIQTGLAGAAVLVAMWVAHLMLFRASGLIAWIGLTIVLQNIVASLFNSHLFDFSAGWLYVFGVGVTGGLMNQQKSTASRLSNGNAVLDQRVSNSPNMNKQA
jgi:hypothetical protein